MLHRLVLSAAIAILAVGWAHGASVGAGKKLLEFGWHTPSIEELAARGSELGAAAQFDGVITSGSWLQDGKKKDFAWVFFGRDRIPWSAARKWIDGLNSAGLKRLRENFLRVNTMPGGVDWFDDFSTILHNAEVLSKVARAGGCRGMLLDFEEYSRRYGTAPFTYAFQTLKDEKTFEEYAKQVRLRGREIGRALTKHYPDIVLLMTHGHSWPYDLMADSKVLSETVYGMLPAFVDGLLEGASPRAEFVDAYEASYGYRDMVEFKQARELIKAAGSISRDPELYAKRIRIGFGLWIDYPRGGQRWDPGTLDADYFTPDEFEYAAFCAQAASDEYVWIYTEKPDWWTGADLPEACLKALIRSRQDHDVRRAPRRSLLNEPAGKMDVSSKTTPGADDASAFGDLWTDYVDLATLPRIWRFALDPEDVGIRKQWYLLGFDDSRWKSIEIGEWWEPQGYLYDGVAWYRVEFDAPDSARGKLWLAFGAVDDTALVYVNGREAGEHDDIARADFGRRFLIEVTGIVKPAQRNQITVRVMDRRMLGGIWKSVKLVARQQEGIQGK